MEGTHIKLILTTIGCISGSVSAHNSISFFRHGTVGYYAPNEGLWYIGPTALSLNERRCPNLHIRWFPKPYFYLALWGNVRVWLHRYQLRFGKLP